MFGVIALSKKKYVLKNKFKFFSSLFIISVFIFTMVYTAVVSGFKEPEYKTIIVKSGDTLWSIAERYAGDGNIREYIHNVKQINNMDSGILYENTSIIIPEN